MPQKGASRPSEKEPWGAKLFGFADKNPAIWAAVEEYESDDLTKDLLPIWEKASKNWD